MKIIIILTLLIAFIATLGMFYWMWKAKEGELNLKSSSWHFKLQQYMWDVELWEIRNACPYYWTLVLSLIILIPYLVIRYGLVKPLSFIPWDKLKLPEFNIKSKILTKIPILNIPTTQKQAFKIIYTKSRDILIYITLIVIGIILLITLYLKAPLLITCIILSAISLVIITWILHVYFEELDKYHLDHYINFIKGIFGIISIPFVIVYTILHGICTKIGDFYTNSCPPIQWD